MHLIVLLVVNLVEKLLPMVVEVEEKFLVLNHLCLAVQKHGCCLSEMLSRVEEVAHSVVMQTLPYIFKDIDSIDDDAFGRFK